MSSYTTWGQRKALGKRYAIDPAYQAEMERLEKEYALIPGREARALNEKQFNENLAWQKSEAEKNREAAEKSGMMGTIGNVAQTVGLAWYLNGSRVPPQKGLNVDNIPYQSETPEYIPSDAGAYGDDYYGYGRKAIDKPEVGYDIPKTGDYTYGTTPALTDAPAYTPADAGAYGDQYYGYGGGATGGTGAAGAAEGGATLGSIGSGVVSASPYIAAWAVGMPILRSIMQAGTKDAFGVDKDSSNTLAQMNRIAGSARGVIAPAYEEITGKKMPEVAEALTNPAGYLAGKAGCIIVTACTDRYSYEVEITRAYRDKFLDAEQLRGYYALAEMIVPLIKSNKTVRKNVKKWLVDRLVDYGEYKLGMKETKPLCSSWLVSKVFLGMIKMIGMILPRYVRANGEVF